MVVNVQGDEPLIDPALIDACAALLVAATGLRDEHGRPCHRRVDEFANPNVVKVVLDGAGRALYFSRAPIPWWRDGYADGITAPARAGTAAPHRPLCLPAPASCAVSRAAAGPLEAIESLEQLRVLWHGDASPCT